MTPKGEYRSLGDVCEKASSNISQNQLVNETGKYPIFGAGGFIKNVGFYHQKKEYVAIIKDGAGIGRLSLLPAYSSVIGTMQYLIPKDILDIRYFYYSLSNIDFNKYKNGSTIPHIYFRDYSVEPILILPLQEQRRIVAVLDESFEAITKAKENAEKNLANAHELFEACLQNVFSASTDGWTNTTLGEICSKIGSGATPRGGKKSYQPAGISLIRSMNVYDREFVEENLAFLSKLQAKELSNVTLQENDVLLNITGASVARCCMLPKKYLPGRVNQHVSIIRAKSEVVLPIFLAYLLTSKSYKDKLLHIGERGGSTRQAITKAQLENFSISFPDTKEQRNIITKLDTLWIKVGKLNRIYEQKLADLEKLKKSILQKVFSGELAEVNS